ncbi:hypothetical protein BpHYR1_013103 [Brachionus plicatilis]|uniref:Uncharacterized protein n=1 Tax=Brachionus plicatilis TaxID=10195 RepID=A0A3M7PII2_BRAPC|nr:hypothetical protein BpHYR1_013103 [Brachionus plicatilis]
MHQTNFFRSSPLGELWFIYYWNNYCSQGKSLFKILKDRDRAWAYLNSYLFLSLLNCSSFRAYNFNYILKAPITSLVSYIFQDCEFCEVQFKRTEQSFKINFVNAEWCNIQSCINCKSLLMMCKISAKCTTLLNDH